MKLSDQPAEIQQAVACFEAFRRLGFIPDQIRLGVHQGGLIVQLTWRGLTFNAQVMPTDLTDVEFQEIWQEFATQELPGLPEEELLANYERSIILQEGETLLLAMEEHGISYPAHPRWGKHN